MKKRKGHVGPGGQTGRQGKNEDKGLASGLGEPGRVATFSKGERREENRPEVVYHRAEGRGRKGAFLKWRRKVAPATKGKLEKRSLGTSYQRVKGDGW